MVRVGGSGPAPGEVSKQMTEVVIGDQAPFSELETLTDWEAVKKVRPINLTPEERIK